MSTRKQRVQELKREEFLQKGFAYRVGRLASRGGCRQAKARHHGRAKFITRNISCYDLCDPPTADQFRDPQPARKAGTSSPGLMTAIVGTFSISLTRRAISSTS